MWSVEGKLDDGLYPTAQSVCNLLLSVNIDAPGIPDIPGHLNPNGYSTISNGKIYHQKGGLHELMG